MSQTPKTACRSLKLFGCLAAFTSLSVICAISHPDVFSFLPCLIGCEARAANDLINSNKSISTLIDLKKLDKKLVSIVVEKSKYRLTVYYKKQAIKSYAIVLGANPKDDKLREGDKRTPEGLFRVRDLYYHSEWSKFIWLDYPTKDSWRKYNEAKLNGQITVSDRIGGEIGIHGVESGKDWIIDRRINWTWGCISLKNKDVDEIYPLLQRGTTIEILR